MFPTGSTAHWGRYTPHYDPHHFFGHGCPHPAATAGAAEAASAAAATTGPQLGRGGAPPMSWHYYYGRGMRRGLGFRRFIWFGLGVAAAAWYYKSKERARLANATYSGTAITAPPVQANDWQRKWHEHAKQHELDPTPTAQAAWPAAPTAASASNTVPRANDAGQHAALPTLAPADERAHDTSCRRSWSARWHRDSNKAADRAPAESAALAVQPQGTVPTQDMSGSDATLTTDQEDIQRIKQAIERFWGEKKLEASAAQERANDKAREYAREKLDKLSAALDQLRGSLQVDGNKPEKKIV